MIEALPALLRPLSLRARRLQAHRGALPRHGAPERRGLRQPFQERIHRPRLDRRRHQPALRLHHHPRERARVVRQQHHRRGPLRHVDSRRLGHVSRMALRRVPLGQGRRHLATSAASSPKSTTCAPSSPSAASTPTPPRTSTSRARSCSTPCAASSTTTRAGSRSSTTSTSSSNIRTS